MKKDSSKIKGIVEELISNSINAGAKNVETSIKDDGNQIIIKVIDDGVGMDEEKLKEVKKILQKERNFEMEEYYGELAGQDMRPSGLRTVTIMTDKAKVSSELGSGTSITVYRTKDR